MVPAVEKLAVPIQSSSTVEPSPAASAAEVQASRLVELAALVTVSDDKHGTTPYAVMLNRSPLGRKPAALRRRLEPAANVPLTSVRSAMPRTSWSELRAAFPELSRPAYPLTAFLLTVFSVAVRSAVRLVTSV